MNNGDKTFIQSLLRVDHVDFGDLVLLPNLKLIELLDYQIHSMDVDFGSPENTNLINRQSDSLGSKELRQNVLRQILCNFLAVIMYRERQNGIHNLCLRFTLLVPNVYYQNKVASIIDGLYEDFDTLCKLHQDKFICYRGVEIQTISESDASYFGVRLQDNNLVDKRDAYSLIIDAGKGTTDFSLLHQTGPILSHYESIYRSGIPASGHVLTYAFYEALRDYFSEIDKKDVFEGIIRSAYTGERHTLHLLSFIAALEEQKKNYGGFKDQDDTENPEARSIADATQNWDNLIQYIEWLNDHQLAIPGVKDKVEQKVNNMITLLNTSIIQYAHEHQITFLRVYLSGRAFRFSPFREAVISRLIESGLVTSNEQIEFNDNMAKIACLRGGIADRDYTVNRKSTMLSVPTMSENVGEISGLRSRMRHLLRFDKPVMANVDFDFFYKGLKKGNVSNVSIDICGRIIQRGFNPSQDVYLYFVGDGYLLKYGYNSEKLEEDARNYQCDRQILEQLTKESLFPFDIESMGYKRQKNQNVSTADTNYRSQGTLYTTPIEQNTPVIDTRDSNNIGNLDD